MHMLPKLRPSCALTRSAQHLAPMGLWWFTVREEMELAQQLSSSPFTRVWLAKGFVSPAPQLPGRWSQQQVRYQPTWLPFSSPQSSGDPHLFSTPFIHLRDKKHPCDFPGGPVVKNLSCNMGVQVPSLVRDAEQLSPWAAAAEPVLWSPFTTTKEPLHCNEESCMTQWRLCVPWLRCQAAK